MVIKGKSICKISKYEGIPKPSDMKIKETEYSEELADGDYLVEAMYISVDPYQRMTYLNNPESDQPVAGFQLSKVIKSKNKAHPVGAVVYTLAGWQSVSKNPTVFQRVDTIKPAIDLKHYMGLVGMPGWTAYFGLLEICKPKPGETVMVSTCAGAVGSVVGQIAKIKGCRVIGSCGSDEKIEYAKSIGYDDAFNYKTEKYTEALKRLAPDGIDCYYDNVGGVLSSRVLECMNTGGRIAICGAISSYNEAETPMAPMLQGTMIMKQLKMEGFLVNQFFTVKGALERAYTDLVKWVAEGKIKGRETIYEGFENIPQAFIDLFLGKNTGKAIIKVESTQSETGF